MRLFSHLNELPVSESNYSKRSEPVGQTKQSLVNSKLSNNDPALYFDEEPFRKNSYCKLSETPVPE